MPISAFQKSLIFGVVLVFIFSSSFLVLWSLVGSQPLGHDEAVYLTEARSWIENAPADEFGIYRPIGMPGFAWFILQLTDSEKDVRMFGVFFSAITLVFLFLLFQRTASLWVALATVLLVGTSPLFLREAPNFLNDIPSAGMLFAALWLLWRYYKTAGQSKAIYIAAPFTALAFYLRYGAAASLGVIGIMSALILFPKFVNKEGSAFPPLGKTIAFFILLMLPHLIQAFQVYGNPTGILTKSASAAGREYLGQGLIDFIQWLPYTLAGPLVGAAAITGVIVTFVILFRKNLRQNHEGLLWLGAIGIGVFFLTGLLIHAEPRYVFFPVALLSGVGISGIYMLLEHKPKILHAGFMALIMLTTLPFAAIHYQQTDTFFRAKEQDRLRNVYVQASEIIHNDSIQEKSGCAVWAITTYRPAVSWYSECNTLKVADPQTFRKQLPSHQTKTMYSIVRTTSRDPQITPENAENFGVSLTEIFRGAGEDVIVYRINYQKPGVPQYIPNQAGD
ncbi:MAG TPA: glycosyltransferase family 39 protein [Candidatus Paceibacterota bacterium]